MKKILTLILVFISIQTDTIFASCEGNFRREITPLEMLDHIYALEYIVSDTKLRKNLEALLDDPKIDSETKIKIRGKLRLADKINEMRRS